MNNLTDPFQRRIHYLRLSVTDQCDLRCLYCIPKDYKNFQEPDHWLTFDELEHLVGLFTKLGVRNIRITGGEPLLRKRLPELTKTLSMLPGVQDLALSTNAVQLTKLAEALKNSGVQRINVSLDSLQAERFKFITRGKLEKTLQGLQSAKAAGLAPIKINMVVMRDINDDEIESMLDFCIKNEFTLRYIETMPMGQTGQSSSAHYISAQTIKERLARHYNLIPILDGTSKKHSPGPARYMRVAGTDAKVGFISAISDHFCASCNRLRLGVDGTLYPCLGQNNAHSLGRLLRQGADDETLLRTIQQAVNLKPERHEFNEKPEQVMRFMSVTGG